MPCVAGDAGHVCEVRAGGLQQLQLLVHGLHAGRSAAAAATQGKRFPALQACPAALPGDTRAHAPLCACVLCRRLAPSCQDELLSKGLFKTAGGVLQILIR